MLIDHFLSNQCPIQGRTWFLEKKGQNLSTTWFYFTALQRFDKDSSFARYPIEYVQHHKSIAISKVGHTDKTCLENQVLTMLLSSVN